MYSLLDKLLLPNDSSKTLNTTSKEELKFFLFLIQHLKIHRKLTKLRHFEDTQQIFRFSQENTTIIIVLQKSIFTIDNRCFIVYNRYRFKRSRQDLSNYAIFYCNWLKTRCSITTWILIFKVVNRFRDGSNLSLQNCGPTKEKQVLTKV